MMSRVLHYVDFALMQTNADAQRLLRLGINAHKVKVTGNIKFDQQPIPQESIFLSYFSERFDISAGKSVDRCRQHARAGRKMDFGII